MYKLIAQITTLSEDTRYAAIPLSWVDGRIRHGITDVVSRNALQQVVLPSMACKLTQRIDDLSAATLKVSENAAAPDAVYADYLDQLKRQLHQLSALEDNLVRFDRIAQPGSMDRGGQLLDFGALAEYLYGSALPADTIRRDSPLSDSLAAASYPDPPAISPELRERLGKQFERMVTARYQRKRYDDRSDPLYADHPGQVPGAQGQGEPQPGQSLRPAQQLPWGRRHQEGLCVGKTAHAAVRRRP